MVLEWSFPAFVIMCAVVRKLYLCLFIVCRDTLKLCKAPELKLVEFARNVDPDEVTHNEPPHLGLHCLPSSF